MPKRGVVDETGTGPSKLLARWSRVPVRKVEKSQPGGRSTEQSFWRCGAGAHFDLFDPNCPPLPANAQPPLVMVNDK
jgi:hypothetical protein